MDFMPSEIARLVLGYLGDEKCDQAYNAFLKSSVHLVECLKMKEEGRTFITKFCLLSLCDILYEYAAVYSLVEERLKKVDSETFKRLTTQGTLLDKLTFLLNGTDSGQTVLFSITVPPGKSPQTSAVAHVRKKLRSCSTSERRKESRVDSSKSSSLNDLDDNNLSLNVETTALSSLPGNVKQKAVTFNDNLEESSDQIHKTPRRKAQILPPRRTHSNVEDDEESNLDNVDLDAITKAFVDHEFHQKIAKNINKIIYTPDSSKTSVSKDSCSAQITPVMDPVTNNANSVFSVQLDNAIKKVVQQTEADPLFEHFLQELLEPGAEADALYDNLSVSIPPLPPIDSVKHSPLRSQLRNTRLKNVDASMRLCAEIDHENSVAIQNIIAINTEDKPQSTPVPKENFPLRKSLSASSINNITAAQMFTEFNPTEPTDSSAVSTAPISQTPINVPESASYPEPTKSVPISFNSNNEPVEINSVPVVSSRNVMMVGPQSLKSSGQIIMVEPFQPMYQQPMMADNRIYLINSSKGAGLLMQPAFQISQQPTVITESDMNKMPVIMCDEPTPSTSYSVKKNPPPPRKISKLLPKNLKPDSKDTIKISSSIQETESMNYFVNIQAEPKRLSGNITSQQNIEEKSIPVALDTTTINTSSSTVETAAVVTEVRSVPLISMSTEKKILPEEKCLTPVQTTSTMEAQSTSSSKSHIRALDFSTPPKKHGSAHKSSSSSSARKEKFTKVSKESVRSLFVSPVKKSTIPIATKTPGPKLQGDWSGNDIIFQDDKAPRNDLSNDSLNDSLDSKGRPKRAAVLRSPYGEKKASTPVKYKILLDGPETKILKDKECWDKELRELITDPPAPVVKKSPVKRPVRRRVRAKSVHSAINTTAETASSIEEALAKMEESDGEEKKDEAGASSPKKQKIEEKNPKKTGKTPVVKGKQVVEKKKSATAKKAPEKKSMKAKAEKPEKVKKNEKVKSDDKKVEAERPKREPAKRKAKQNAEANMKKDAKRERKFVEEEEEDEKEEPKETIRNMNPRRRKKCNIGHVLKPTAAQVTPITPEGLAEALKTEQLKRDSAEDKVASDTLTNIILAAPVVPMEELEVSFPSKITPDMSSKSKSIGPMLAKRNITPALETPVKSDNFLCPLTPNILSTYIDSPLNAMLNDNPLPLEFSAIMTPNFPVTPSIVPITPNIPSAGSMGSYASRPTDYSTCSSYYHPSDCGQGQKLEHVLIQEAIKMEDFKSKAMNTSTPCKVTTENVPDNNENIQEEKRKGTTASSVLLDPLEDSNSISTNKSSPDFVPSDTSNSSCSSSSSSDSSDTSDSDDTTDLSGLAENNNKTVIHIQKLKSPATKPSPKKPKSPEKKLKSRVTKKHADFLSSVEEKRRRTVMRLNAETDIKKLPPKKSRVLRNPKKNITAAKVAKGRKSMEINKDGKDLQQFIKKSPRKSKSPIKSSIESVATKLLNTKKPDFSSVKALSNSDTSFDSIEMPKGSTACVYEEEIVRLHISSDEEYNVRQAEYLIEGLKLVPKNSTPNKNESLVSSVPSTEVLKSNPEVHKDKINIQSHIILNQNNLFDVEKLGVVKTVEDAPFKPQQKDVEQEQKETFEPVPVKQQKEIEKEEDEACEEDEEISYSNGDYLVTTNITEDSEEYIHTEHVASSKKSDKSLADYDFTVLKDDVKASYIDDENSLHVITLTVTPFTDLLCLPAKRKRRVIITQSPHTTEEEDRVKALKPSTLNLLYKEDIGDSSSSTCSDLIEIKTSKNNKHVAEKTDASEKVPVKITVEKKFSKNELYNAVEKMPAVPEDRIKEITIYTDDETDPSQIDKDEEILMTLALTGTDLAEDNTTKKRKMEADPTKQNPEKKLKKNPQRELMRTIDVDSFLAQVHGAP